MQSRPCAAGWIIDPAGSAAGGICGGRCCAAQGNRQTAAASFEGNRHAAAAPAQGNRLSLRQALAAARRQAKPRGALHAADGIRVRGVYGAGAQGQRLSACRGDGGVRRSGRGYPRGAKRQDLRDSVQELCGHGRQ